VAAVLLAAPVTVDRSYVQGRSVVRDRTLVGIDIGDLVARHNEAARRLVS
jgi:hypothetical protein